MCSASQDSSTSTSRAAHIQESPKLELAGDLQEEEEEDRAIAETPPLQVQQSSRDLQRHANLAAAEMIQTNRFDAQIGIHEAQAERKLSPSRYDPGGCSHMRGGRRGEGNESVGALLSIVI